LLRFFVVYRALVRAKVALLSGQEAWMHRYLGLARSETARRTPRLIITCGLSGSGKSWLSERLSASCSMVRIRSDVERKRMAGLRPNESSRSRGGEGLYTKAFNERVYAHVLEVASTLLGAGESVIVDAAFLKRAERDAFAALAREQQASFTILHCIASEAELLNRLEARARRSDDASEATCDVLPLQREAWEPFAVDETPFVVDAAPAPTTEDVERLLARMRP
jgi:uncharacterized protein